MCLFPRLVKNPKYTATKKNGGIIPPVPNIRVIAVPIKCGKCMECRKREARDWQIRLQEHIKTHTNGKFLTLTFSTESLQKLSKETKLKGYELDNFIATRAMRLFNERWRKKFKKALHHWFVTELGQQSWEHIHLHGIAFTNESYDTIEKLWKYGYIWRGQWVNDQTINYCTKYVSKMDVIHQYYKPLTLCSPGIGQKYTKQFIQNKYPYCYQYTHRDKKGKWHLKIGKSYIIEQIPLTITTATNNKFKGQTTNETYKLKSGHTTSLPIYWRNNLYTDEQKEQLWLNKLDKQERYVLGQKIDISKNQNEYFKALKYAQKINSQMGYGTDKIKWNRFIYEQERRILLQQQRNNNNNNNKPTPSAGGLIKRNMDLY